MATETETALRRTLLELTSVKLDDPKGHPYPGQRYRHGWIPVVGRTLADLATAQTAEEIEDDYGEAVDNEEFAPGAVVELSATGEVHFDVASNKADRWHVLATMGQDDAESLAEDIDWAIEAKPGRRTPDPVNGLVDWRDNDGTIIGYTPDGSVRIGFPAGEEDFAVFDLTNAEALELWRALNRLSMLALPEEDAE